ncbi:MAG: wax ester/triacylglycerol synthase domain-containing protein [Actinomycetota bacterium]
MSDGFHERDADFPPEMSDEEALMWRVGADPWLDPSGSLLSILDRPADVELARRKLAAGIVTMPRLAERVAESPNPLDAPRWEIDPDFDLANHIVEVEVPAPGDHRALLDLTTEIHTTPFAAGRPPWIIHVVTGLADGRGALISRLHHSIADGVGSLRMAEIFLSLEPDAELPAEVDLDAVLDERRAAAPPHEPTDTADALLAALAGPVGLMKSAAAEMALIGADPARAQRTGNQALETVRTVIDQLVGDPYLDSTSELWTGRSGQRYYVTARMALSAAKAAATARGGTVNDLYVTALADAAIAYHAERDAEPRTIAMSFVRSTRTGSGAGGNAFVPIKVRAPAGGTDPADRFAALHEAMAPSEERENEPGLAAVSSMAALIPTPVLTRLGRDQGTRIDVVTSNIRGAPVPIHVGAARVLATFPVGPVAGAACNATVMSHEDSLDVGIMIDPAAIDDPDRFGELVQATFDGYAADISA